MFCNDYFMNGAPGGSLEPDVMEDVAMFPFHHPADAIKLINSELDVRRERSRLRQLAATFGRSRFARQDETADTAALNSSPRHETISDTGRLQPESSAI